MMTKVSHKNTVTIPADIRRALGIKAGWQVTWEQIGNTNQLLVHVNPDRGELARRLLGAGKRFNPQRDSVAELIAEREAEDRGAI